ncbi:hypothetical protein TCAL_14746 [Tigriopus californicus]|uniref:Integrase catalytic domain-containing protein n=1 Tax=Tigriopus californicus TaxID=6832 RepID=A0A553PES1_TIGCA|nr:hypothetical protein TCAL_14746 [Tigriopus californicus]
MRDQVLTVYGVPEEVVTDQGVQFMSGEFANFLKSSGIKHCPTSPFHPASDGLTERYNRTLMNALRCFTEEKPENWTEYIQSCVFAYRSSKQQSTGYSPFELLKARTPRMGIDVCPLHSVNNHDDLLEEAFRIASRIRPVARENIKKSQEKSKKNYDKANHVEATPVKEKDFVMWLRPAPVAGGGSQKLKPPFQGPYLVESVSDKTARISDQTGRCQIVNVDQLKITKVDDPHLGVLRKRGRPRKSGGGCDNLPATLRDIR